MLRLRWRREADARADHCADARARLRTDALAHTSTVGDTSALGKTDPADAVEFSFEFQNGEKCEIEMDGVCDGSVMDVD